jgi:hypothetical protein
MVFKYLKYELQICCGKCEVRSHALLMRCVICTTKYLTTMGQPFCFHFFWVKNNKKRVVKRESKNLMRVWERELSTKLSKMDCTNIISH